MAGRALPSPGRAESAQVPVGEPAPPLRTSHSAGVTGLPGGLQRLLEESRCRFIVVGVERGEPEGVIGPGELATHAETLLDGESFFAEALGLLEITEPPRRQSEPRQCTRLSPRVMRRTRGPERERPDGPGRVELVGGEQRLAGGEERVARKARRLRDLPCGVCAAAPTEQGAREQHDRKRPGTT